MMRSASHNTAVVGTAVTFSAQVTAGAGTPGGQAPPTGTITFKDGSTSISSALPLGAGNQAAFTTSSLTPGSHSINAVYSGDPAFVPSTGTMTETVTAFSSLYELDGYGGMHPVSSPGLPDKPANWPGWKIARAIAFRADAQSGYVLDGWGGVHPFGGAPVLHATAFWGGWDIAHSIALDPDGAGGYVLDGWGGLHQFGNAPAVTGGPFWRGWDIARSVALIPGGMHMGYVLDGWGGVHPFGGAPSLTMPSSAAFAGKDIGRAIAIR